MEPVATPREGEPEGEFPGQPRPARVFVALKMTPDLAQELAGLSASLSEPDVRRVAPRDIHLTLVPPWNERVISAAVAKLASIAAAQAPFDLKIRHLSYGPDARRPRLLWAECSPSLELVALRAALLAEFGQTDDRPFRPHVTLARIRQHGAAIARRHPVGRALALSQRISAVALMQSPQPGGGAGYTVLASLPLGTSLEAQPASG